ncbi:MAG: hypothetical protein K0U36_02345 [Alphaproteobacteria bacterium]|nr:hypothetical protein [Alphaproteobacteria bacterium]
MKKISKEKKTGVSANATTKKSRMAIGRGLRSDDHSINHTRVLAIVSIAESRARQGQRLMIIAPDPSRAQTVRCLESDKWRCRENG